MAQPERKTYAEDRQNFVATRMSLPLFMVSRNRIRNDHLDGARKHFKLAATHYNKMCQNENRGEAPSAATYDHYRHICGFDKMTEYPYPPKRPLHYNRTLTTWRDWQHAPNRYGVVPEPYLERSGTKGAIFAKLPTNKSLVTTKKPTYHFYDMPAETDRFNKPWNAQKGVFLSNAREHRPSTRFMVSNPVSCYRNPSDPGPTSHHTPYYELAANLVPVVKTPRPNPHLFNKLSCVPCKPNTMEKRHISFEPGPGRYETRFGNLCPCPTGKISMPGLQLRIDEQKRNRFRRQAYKRINRKLYCEPDWRHVEGQGHTHIFQMHKADLPKPRSKKTANEAKKSDKHLTLFADAKYLNMLITPQRQMISLREFPVPQYVPRIFYNCVAKRVVRKQLHINKKIAFNSGQERFKDMERPMQLTVRQLEAIKARLPVERRLIDQPLILRKSEIVSKLTHVPDHQKSTYIPKLRKRLFKFLPTPAAHVLVTDAEIRPDIPFDPEHPTGLYRKQMVERTFFRESVLTGLDTQKEEPQALQPVASQVSKISRVASKQSIKPTVSKMQVTLVAPTDVKDAAAPAAADAAAAAKQEPAATAETAAAAPPASGSAAAVAPAAEPAAPAAPAEAAAAPAAPAEEPAAPAAPEPPPAAPEPEPAPAAAPEPAAEPEPVAAAEPPAEDAPPPAE